MFYRAQHLVPHVAGRRHRARRSFAEGRDRHGGVVKDLKLHAATNVKLIMLHFFWSRLWLNALVWPFLQFVGAWPVGFPSPVLALLLRVAKLMSFLGTQREAVATYPCVKTGINFATLNIWLSSTPTNVKLIRRECRLTSWSSSQVGPGG